MIFGDLGSRDIARIAPDMIAMLPLGAVEQHGDHLPVITDTAIVTEFARRAEVLLPDHVVLLPTFWTGSSHHHLSFPGTLSISSETFVRVVMDILECLVSSGFQRIFLLNGHGGNQTPFAEALYRISLIHRAPRIAAQSYWKLAANELAEQNFMATSALSHACEYETSLMLALGAAVKMPLAHGESPQRISQFYDPLDRGSSRVVVSETFDQLSLNGALGSPEKATADKGERLFNLITETIISFLKDFKQWPLRQS